VVNFDGSTPGTAPESWTADERLSTARRMPIPDHGPVVVVAPHPDDETLGAGGLIVRLRTADIPVIIILVTDGGASDRLPDSSRDHLVLTRHREFRQAVSILAPDAAVFELNFADGKILDQRAAVKQALRNQIIDIRPALVVAPWSGDGHPDHRIVSELCAEICALLLIRMIEYPIWMWHWANPDSIEVPWPRIRTIELTDRERRLKNAAIGQYVSQTTSRDGRAATLHPDFLRNFTRSQEVYIGSDGTLPAEYFNDLYARHDDPWSFETRWYEKRKRAITMGALPREHYNAALEIGSSTGLLTRGLAARADSVLAVDIAAHAVAATAARTSEWPGVTVERHDFSQTIPDGTFDLIVLSEVGYYLDYETLVSRLTALVGALAPDGHLLLCHWRHEVADYPLSGDQVHQAADNLDHVTRFVHYIDEDFVLGVYSDDPSSVARRTGLT
jgi:LmbE family N-acetylglucosaminyl deacetylase/SAM-dependent methyltransferase